MDTSRPPAAAPSWAARWDARIDQARARLRRRAPRAYRRLLAVTAAAYLLTDLLVPPRRVHGLTVVLLALTLLDSAATYLWVSREVAVEGNPLVAAVIGTFGDGPGLVLRTLVSAGLVVLLGWLGRRHWEARGGLAVVAVAIVAVTGVHAYGLALLVGRAA